jgi:hypothetical protein
MFRNDTLVDPNHSVRNWVHGELNLYGHRFLRAGNDLNRASTLAVKGHVFFLVWKGCALPSIFLHLENL